MESTCSPVDQCEWETTHEDEATESISFTVGADGVVSLTRQPQRSPQQERQAALIDKISRLVDAQCVQNSLRVNDLDEEVAAWASIGFRTRQYPDGTNGLFFSAAPTNIAVQAYVAQFVKCLPVSEAVFIVALVYMDRVCAHEPMLRVTHRNVHRLLTVAFTVAIKQLEDEPFDNATMASLGGLVSVKELNQLEVEFLKRLDWRTGVDLGSFDTYRRLLWN